MNKCDYKQVGNYKIKEIPNSNGKSIEEILQDAFLIYCAEQMQKQLLG